MAYQLRFLKTTPISSWLNQTASLLEISMYFHQRTSLPPDFNPDGKNRRLIRKALIKGLSSFLVKRSLCDTHPNCDLGLHPALENRSDDRFEEGVINAPVKRYLFRGNTDLAGAVQKMSEVLFKQIPEKKFEERKTKLILKDALALHLFENTRCFHHAYCQRSLVQKMDKDFAGHPYHPTLSFKKTVHDSNIIYRRSTEPHPK
jgi:hypothetical protein